MIDMTFKQAKQEFAKALPAKLNKPKKRFLYKWGTAVRQDAKKALNRKGPKRGPRPAPAPPRKISGLLRDFVFFFVEGDSSVIVGPIKLSRRSKEVPSLLEYGGTQVVPERVKRRVLPGEEIRVPSSVQNGTYWARTGRRITASYNKRPYMEPAKEKVNREKLPRLWKDSIR